MAKPILERLTLSTASLRAPGDAARALVVVASLMMTALLAGCRSVDNAQVDLMERELREQEDYIYELEDYLMEYSEKLRQYRMAECQTPATETSKPEAAKRSTLVRPELVKDPPRRPSSGGKGRSLQTRPSAAAPADSPVEATPVEPAEEAAEPAIDPTPEADTTDPAELDPAKLAPPDLEIGDPSASLEWQKTAPAAPATKSATADLPGELQDESTSAGSPPGDEAPPYVPEPLTYRSGAGASEPDAAAEFEPFEAPMPEEFAEQAVPDSVAPDAPAAEETALALPPAVEGPELPPLVESAADQIAEPSTDPARAIASHLQVRQVFTQPAADDPGRLAGLLVVVEALNDMDEPVEAAGTVSLMVMVRDASGGQQRVDRWDFTVEETRAAWQSSRLGDGLHLQLPLDGTELPTGPLELWARLVNDEGSKLLTQLPFDTAELVAFEDAIAAPVEAAVATTAVDEAPAVEESVSTILEGAAAESAPVEAETTASETPAPPAPTWRAATQRIDGLAEAADRAAGGASGWTPSKAAIGGAVGQRAEVKGVLADAAKGDVSAVKTATSASTWQRRATATR